MFFCEIFGGPAVFTQARLPGASLRGVAPDPGRRRAPAGSLAGLGTSSPYIYPSFVSVFESLIFFSPFCLGRNLSDRLPGASLGGIAPDPAPVGLFARLGTSKSCVYPSFVSIFEFLTFFPLSFHPGRNPILPRAGLLLLWCLTGRGLIYLRVGGVLLRNLWRRDRF